MAFWARIDSNILQNPKLFSLKSVEKFAYIASILAAKTIDKDGIFDAKTVAAWTDFRLKNASVLVEAGLWEPTEIRHIFRVHDYTDYNTNMQNRARLAEISRANGAKGGRPRKQDKNTNPDETQTKTQMGFENDNPDETQMGFKNLNPEITRLNTIQDNTYPPGFINEPTPPRGGAQQSCDSSARAKKKPPKRGKREGELLPPDWEPTENAKAKCAELGIPLGDAVRIFRDWAEQGKYSKNWHLSFAQALRTWVPETWARSIEAKTRLDNARWRAETAKRPLPADWLPNAQGENLAVSAGILDLTEAVGFFRDYHNRKKTLSGDWDAEWRAALRWLPDALKSKTGGTADTWKMIDQYTARLEHPQIVTETAHREPNPPKPSEDYPETGNARENGLNVDDYSTQGMDWDTPPF